MAEKSDTIEWNVGLITRLIILLLSAFNVLVGVAVEEVAVVNPVVSFEVVGVEGVVVTSLAFS